MTQSNFKITQAGNDYFIIDTRNDHLYTAQSSDSSMQVGDIKKLLEGALKIIEGTGEEPEQLSQVTIVSDGVYIGERFVNAADVVGFDDSYSHIENSYSPVVQKADSVFQSSINTHINEISASDRAAGGEDISGPSDLKSRDIHHQPNAETPAAARGALANIARFFKRLKWPSFMVKIAEVFEKIFAKDRYVARHTQRAREYIEPTEKKITDVKSFEVISSDDPLHAHVPDAVMLKGEQGDYSPVDHKIEGREALGKGQTREVDDFYSGSHRVTAYNVSSGSAEPGSVIPTSTRFSDESSEGNHLINCYTTHGKGAGIIRTGVIDTPEKAKEFQAAARGLHNSMGRSGPVRVMSHQLNSPEREGKMIRRQHQYLLQQGSKDFQVAHLNAPCNRFYHYTRAHGSKPIASEILTGEKESHEQNIEGMAQYLRWMMEDALQDVKDKLDAMGVGQILQNQESVNAKYSEIDQLEIEIQDLQKQVAATDDKEKLKAQIKEKKGQIQTKEEEIDGLRTKIHFGESPNRGMRGLHKWMKDVAEPEIFANNPNHPMRETMMVYRKLLGSQLDIKGAELERNQEHLMQFVLDKKLGVITAMNCKSGLDRTGFLFALFLGAQDLPEGIAMKVVLNWESYSLQLNKHYRDNDYDPEKVMNVLNEPYQKDADELKAVFSMQQHVLQHLLKVSLPITGISTGVIGLKYGKGMSENLLPLYCIPPVVMNESGKRVQLLTYNKSGKPKGLTSEGHRLITQLSQHRGA